MGVCSDRFKQCAVHCLCLADPQHGKLPRHTSTAPQWAVLECTVLSMMILNVGGQLHPLKEPAAQVANGD